MTEVCWKPSPDPLPDRSGSMVIEFFQCATSAMLFAAAQAWMAHWLEWSANLAIMWLEGEGDVGRLHPRGLTLMPNTEARLGSSGGTGVKPWSENPTTLVMGTYERRFIVGFRSRTVST